MTAEPTVPATPKEFAAHLRANMRPALAPMADQLEKDLDAVVSHIQKPWQDFEELLGNLVGMVDMLATFPEGVDNKRATAALQEFGVSKLGLTRYPTGNDEEKGVLAYMIYAAQELKHLLDIAQVLETDYGVTDIEERLELAERAENVIRWQFDGEMAPFFAALAQSSMGDVGGRIEAVRSWASNDRSGPKPPQPW